MIIIISIFDSNQETNKCIIIVLLLWVRLFSSNFFFCVLCDCVSICVWLTSGQVCTCVYFSYYFGVIVIKVLLFFIFLVFFDSCMNALYSIQARFDDGTYIQTSILIEWLYIVHCTRFSFLIIFFIKKK